LPALLSKTRGVLQAACCRAARGAGRGVRGRRRSRNDSAPARITRFSAEAKDYAERVNARLILIDGPEFVNLMIEHNCGVVEEQTFTLKQVDENFFGDL
jgi:hypothetical protein